MNQEKFVYKNLECIPNIYKCWKCGQIPKQPQFKHCTHSKMLLCCWCIKLQKCRWCRFTYLYYYIDTPEIFKNHFKNIFINCQNCNRHIQGFKFSAHQNKCYKKQEQFINFELLYKNICTYCQDLGQIHYTNSLIEQQSEKSDYFLKQKIQLSEEYLHQIQALKVKCKLCLSVLSYTSQSEHYNTCIFTSVKCENYGCNWVGQRQQFQNHLLGCYPISQDKLDDQNYILIQIEQFIGFNYLKYGEESLNNEVEFQIIFNSMQMNQETIFQYEGSSADEYESFNSL